ncbi:MAG: InlB B-repeat-containing protein [Oscillospiraceae bacterium]|nr:InlB B-repeat-containing protein [Oscillospiraceae bacterium]
MKSNKRILAVVMACMLFFGIGSSMASSAENLPAPAPSHYTTPWGVKMAENDAILSTIPVTTAERWENAIGRSLSAAELVCTSGDGIPDVWKLYGADFNGDGIIDLPLHKMGAVVGTPDIFVEVDWMEGMHSQRSLVTHKGVQKEMTNQQMFDAVAAEFMRNGIRLHIDFGPESVDYVTGVKWKDYPGGSGGNAFPYTTDLIYDGMGANRLEEYIEANLTYLRSPVFYHCMIVTTESIGGNSGFGTLLGMSTIIYSASIFMHELGHNLGLGHGGRGDDTNYKPNYLSCMNYGYSGCNFQFSEYQLPDLDERNLSEPAGIDPQRLTVPMGAAGTSLFFRNGNWVYLPSVAGVAVDYNGNGNTTDTGVVMDINNDGQLTVLVGKKDWENLQLDHSGIGDLGRLRILTISYHATSGTGAPANQLKLKGQPVILRAEKPTRTGANFLGWSTEWDGKVEYAPGDTYSVEADLTNYLEPKVTLYAVWDVPSTTYTLTVYNGTGSGSYGAGMTVNITANTAPNGKVFDRWTSTAGTIASPTSTSTTFTMPAGAVTVTANYKDAPRTILSTKYEATLMNWILFIVFFGWLWMWIG